MCKHGTQEDVLVYIAPHLSHTGRGRFDTKPVDKCIAPIIRALVNHGIYTTGCCCGHGKMDGYIGLLDGRELVIVNKPKALNITELVEFTDNILRSKVTEETK